MNRQLVWKYSPQQGGIRYQNRQPVLWMRMNLKEGLCWCGKPKELWKKYQRKYCCYEHSQLWYYSIRAYWEQFRYETIKQNNYTCQECGFKTKKDDTKFDVDHIIAICLGGMCFDSENVRTLCRKCHHKKTKEDIRKLSMKNKEASTIGNI